MILKRTITSLHQTPNEKRTVITYVISQCLMLYVAIYQYNNTLYP